MSLVGKVDPWYYEDPLRFVEKKTLPQRSLAEDIQRELFAQAGVLDVGRVEGVRLDLGVIAPGGKRNPIAVRMVPHGRAGITFALSEPSMVNLWVDLGAREGTVGTIGGLSMPMYPNLMLTLEGDTLSHPYTSDKRVRDEGGTERTAPLAGESVSTVLPRGTYTLTVSDITTYPDVQTVGSGSGVRLPDIPLQLEILPYRTQEIVGRVSIPESPETMPVRMRVAEFDSAGKRIDRVSDLNALTPKNPLWVVVHGMDSSDESDVLMEVVRTLSKHQGMQVVTVDWEEAAQDGIITQDARWTPAVGKWVAQQLIAAGFVPSLIDITGASHGSYVAYYTAEEISTMTKGQKINALVALDPAGNWPLLSGHDHTVIDFKKYARTAIAIEGSWIAGSDALAGTADLSFHVNSLETLPIRIVTEHSLPVTAFADILEHERTCPGTYSKYLSLESIMDPTKREKGYRDNSYKGVFEFEIDVGMEWRNGAQGSYPYALPEALRFRGPDGKERVIPLNCFA
jgi:hypothetical protein